MSVEQYRSHWLRFFKYLGGENVNELNIQNLLDLIKAYNEEEVEIVRKAYEYAEKYDLPQTGGSDIHSTNLTYGGMAFARPLKNIQDFQTAVINREGIVLPGEKLSNVK